ncbi:MAG: riboflavin synthase [Actinomycetota bacterium]|nr:riboflavin synthase [Actinomycetota bacterium]
MFTGLIEEVGSFVSNDSERFRFLANRILEGSAVDDSIAVNGCCLTVVALGEDWWEADVSDETVHRTSLSQLSVGDPVNFERAVRYSDRLGGHMVQGHVDGVGTVITSGPDLRIQTPKGLDRYLVEKGSVAVDGVSLTCFDVHENSFSAALIPHTLAVTTLGTYSVGDSVNIEVDMIAKYVERLLTPHNGDN